MDLPAEEAALVEAAREEVRAVCERRRDADRYDTIVAVAASTAGEHYVGIPLELPQPQLNHCAERHAINELRKAEPEGELAGIVVAVPVPDAGAGVTTPCGACRQAIYEVGPDAVVRCGNFVREAEGWTVFPELDRYTAAELLPDHEGLPEWD